VNRLALAVAFLSSVFVLEGAGARAAATDIGVTTDSPGACPAGMPRYDVWTLEDLMNASRGANAHELDPPASCYLIHDGLYVQDGLAVALYITKGGLSATNRRLFIGQSRAGVVIRGRGSVDLGASHVRVSNLTFTLAGYAQDTSFDTVSTYGGTDLRFDHLTLTGDCATGHRGAAFAVAASSTDVVLEDSLVEKFGHCGGDGHLDHGVYIESGGHITIRNNEIRFNSSRGVQLNTEQGAFGSIDSVVIERNRIHHNGHGDFEDGIVLNGGGTGTITNVTIRNNLIYGNYYSGIRFVDVAYGGILVSQNTLYGNGVGALAGPGRSEVNLDGVGSGAGTSVTGNIVVPPSGGMVLYDCFDALPRRFTLSDNVVQGAIPAGLAANCVSSAYAQPPQFVSPSTADFHTQNTAVSRYGAYAATAAVPATPLTAVAVLEALLGFAGVWRARQPRRRAKS
jgi:hypothetical protein